MWPDFSAKVTFRVGNGLKTSFWNETWLGDVNLRILFPDLYIISLQQNDTIAQMWTPQGWDLMFRRALNDWEIATDLWNMFVCILGVNWTMPITTFEVLTHWQGIGKRGSKENWWKNIPACIWWTLWKERNGRCFEGKVSSPEEIKMRCLSLLYFWFNLLDDTSFDISLFPLAEMVIPPPVRPDRVLKYLKPYVLRMHFTNKYVNAQVVHTPTATVAASASSQEKGLRLAMVESKENTRDVAAAAKIGKLLGERLQAKGVPAISVFFKKEQRYHGKVKAVIDSVREAGIELV
ncbi:hypothetical protein H5410_037752 [Solanum commersonii]|nr:hypothetical protein H5410_037752 [Solanum commersonii]